MFIKIFLLSWSLFAAPFDSGYSILCSSGNCPASVGALIARSEENLDASLTTPMGFCSVTLVDRDLVLTAAHCLPPSLKIFGAQCEEKLQIQFPPINGFSAESIPCKEVKEFKASPSASNDAREWALIRLKTNSAREPSSFSVDSLPVGSRIYGYPVFYNAFFPVGEIQKTACEVNELGYLFPQTFHGESALFSANCDRASIPGNSGTGFFNEAGDYIGLQSAIVHGKFQSAHDAARNGSPFILGGKARCFEFLGVLDPACALDADSVDLQKATIMSSTLKAFERAAKKSNLTLSQTSQVLRWKPATPENVSEYFHAVYGDATFITSQDFFKNHKLSHMAQEFTESAVRLVGQVPECVEPSRFDELSGDHISALVFSFADHELYPSANDRLYFRVLENMELEVQAERVELPIKIDRVGSDFTFEYDKSDGRYELTPQERSWAAKECRAEQHQKQVDCQGESKCLSSASTLMPSKKCQDIYKKWGFWNYLRTFKFQVSAC